MRGSLIVLACPAARTDPPVGTVHRTRRTERCLHQARKALDESRMRAYSGHADVVRHTGLARESSILDIELDQRLRMLRDKGDRNDDQAFSLRACPAHFVIS